MERAAWFSGLECARALGEGAGTAGGLLRAGAVWSPGFAVLPKARRGDVSLLLSACSVGETLWRGSSRGWRAEFMSGGYERVNDVEHSLPWL